jgi:hypothetical protein
MIEEALVALLEGAAAVTDIAGERIYPVRLPRGATLPAVTYFLVSGPRDQTQQGPSGLVPARIQVSCWAEGYDAMKSLADAIRLTLDGYRGTTEGVRIGGIELINSQDLFEPEPEIYQRALDFRVKHSETIGA